MKEINGLATIQRTSYSKISTDLVLDINCYSTNMPDTNLEFDMRQGLITGKLCVPCDDVRAPTVASTTNVSTLKNNRNVFDSFGSIPKHSASLLSTYSFSFSGLIDTHKLTTFLDDILFGNGARVGGGYRQPIVTYVNLLDKDQPILSDTERGGGGGRDDIIVYSSAPQVKPISSPDVSNVPSSSSSHSAVTDEMKIFRMKGVLHANGQEYLQVLQGVFDIFEIKASTFLIGSEGDLSAGLNRVVVIGRNIDSISIEEGFLSCLLSPDIK